MDRPVSFACTMLAITAAKIAIAEPYYVPSGSMEPTLLIGDELLATKYPYGYSTASLPLSIVLPDSARILGALPERGDVVVFRSPGDRSQIWVKRVIGLPGDRIALRDGRLSINGVPVGLQPRWRRQMETENGEQCRRRASSRRCPAAREHAILQAARALARSTTCPRSSCRRTTCSSWATTATIPPTAACRSAPAASACCRSPTWSDASTRWSARGTSALKNQPVWTWPSGLRFVAVLHRDPLTERATAPRPTCSTAAAAAA